jgi:hypothetical protein
MSKSNGFSVNDRVTSTLFGMGTVSRMDEKYTTIEFDESGTRKFLTSLVKLEPSDSPAPVKRERARKGKAAAKG